MMDEGPRRRDGLVMTMREDVDDAACCLQPRTRVSPPWTAGVAPGGAPPRVAARAGIAPPREVVAPRRPVAPPQDVVAPSQLFPWTVVVDFLSLSLEALLLLLEASLLLIEAALLLFDATFLRSTPFLLSAQWKFRKGF